MLRITSFKRYLNMKIELLYQISSTFQLNITKRNLFSGFKPKTYTKKHPKTAVQQLGPKQEVHRTYLITETS